MKPRAHRIVLLLVAATSEIFYPPAIHALSCALVEFEEQALRSAHVFVARVLATETKDTEVVTKDFEVLAHFKGTKPTPTYIRTETPWPAFYGPNERTESISPPTYLLMLDKHGTAHACGGTRHLANLKEVKKGAQWCFRDHMNSGEFCLKEGPDNRLNRNTKTAWLKYSGLDEAAKAGDVTAIKQYLERGADINSHLYSRTSRSGNLLDVAIEIPDLEFAQELISQGIDVTRSEALVTAAEMGDLRLVDQLLEFGLPLNPDRHGAPTYTGDLPLNGAIRGGHREVVEYLLDKGASALGRPGFRLPLFVASRLGIAELIPLLLEHGADPNAISFGFGSDYTVNQAPLMIATRNGHATAAAELLKAGADPYEISRNSTPLQLAGLKNRRDFSETFAAAGLTLSASEPSAAGRTITRETLYPSSEPGLFRAEKKVLEAVQAIAPPASSVHGIEKIQIQINRRKPQTSATVWLEPHIKESEYEVAVRAGCILDKPGWRCLGYKMAANRKVPGQPEWVYVHGDPEDHELITNMTQFAQDYFARRSDTSSWDLYVSKIIFGLELQARDRRSDALMGVKIVQEPGGRFSVKDARLLWPQITEK